MNNVNFLSIPTERLIIRDWIASDYKPFAEMNRDSDVMRYFPKHLSEIESNEMIERSTASLNKDKHGFWALENKSNCEFLGFVALAEVKFECSFKGAIEIGWRLKKSSWGKGFATEAAKVLLEYGFNSLNLNEIVSLTAKVNERSWRVMERIGMKRNPAEDFDHPKVEKGHLLERHVLYRIKKS